MFPWHHSFLWASVKMTIVPCITVLWAIEIENDDLRKYYIIIVTQFWLMKVFGFCVEGPSWLNFLRFIICAYWIDSKVIKKWMRGATLCLFWHNFQCYDVSMYFQTATYGEVYCTQFANTKRICIWKTTNILENMMNLAARYIKRFKKSLRTLNFSMF